MSGTMSKRKGARGELEAARELGAILNLEPGAARRGRQYAGGPDSPDVVLDKVALHVEAKRTERLELYAALDQATRDAPPGAVPLVWHRRNRRESVVIVATADLPRLAAEIVRAAGGPGAEGAPAGPGPGPGAPGAADLGQ